MNHKEFTRKTFENTKPYSSNNWKWQTCPSCLLMHWMCSNTSLGCCCAVLFLFRTLKWTDLTVWVKILGDNELTQGHIRLDIMGRAHLTDWGGVGGASEGNKYSMYLPASHLSSHFWLAYWAGPSKIHFSLHLWWLNGLHLLASIRAGVCGDCFCTAWFPFFLCAHGCYAFGSACEQPALNNIILCQEALQVMYVLLPFEELQGG